jgi:hypothetical protein
VSTGEDRDESAVLQSTSVMFGGGVALWALDPGNSGQPRECPLPGAVGARISGIELVRAGPRQPRDERRMNSVAGGAALSIDGRNQGRRSVACAYAVPADAVVRGSGECSVSRGPERSMTVYRIVVLPFLGIALVVGLAAVMLGLQDEAKARSTTCAEWGSLTGHEQKLTLTHLLTAHHLDPSWSDNRVAGTTAITAFCGTDSGKAMRNLASTLDRATDWDADHW